MENQNGIFRKIKIIRLELLPFAFADLGNHAYEEGIY